MIIKLIKYIFILFLFLLFLILIFMISVKIRSLIGDNYDFSDAPNYSRVFTEPNYEIGEHYHNFI